MIFFYSIWRIRDAESANDIFPRYKEMLDFLDVQKCDFFLL